MTIDASSEMGKFSPDGYLATVAFIERKLSEGFCTATILRELRPQGILKSLLNDMDTLSQIAQRSYAHPNGFYKIVLAEAEFPTFKLRLHVWHPLDWTEQYGQPDIHNHRWDFASRILCGGLLVDHFEEALHPPNEYTKFEYRHQSSAAFEIQKIGTTGLRQTSSLNLPKNTEYWLDRRILHSVRPRPNCATATLMLQGETESDSTVVFSRHETVRPKRSAIEELEVNLLREVIKETMSAILCQEANNE